MYIYIYIWYTYISPQTNTFMSTVKATSLHPGPVPSFGSFRLIPSPRWLARLWRRTVWKLSFESLEKLDEASKDQLWLHVCCIYLDPSVTHDFMQSVFHISGMFLGPDGSNGRSFQKGRPWDPSSQDNMVMVAGEITTQAKLDYEKVRGSGGSAWMLGYIYILLGDN